MFLFLEVLCVSFRHAASFLYKQLLYCEEEYCWPILICFHLTLVNHDPALRKLEVVSTVNCLQTIFVCFYLFKDSVTERTGETFLSGNDTV